MVPCFARHHPHCTHDRMEGHGCRSGSLYGPLLGSCQQGNEIWACIICEEFHVYHISSFDEQSAFLNTAGKKSTFNEPCISGTNRFISEEWCILVTRWPAFLHGCERSSRQEGKHCVHISKLLLSVPETLSYLLYHFSVSFKPVLPKHFCLQTPFGFQK